MPDMTPLEAAERLEIISHDISQYGDTVVEADEAEYLDSAASLCRKIASGEYAPVVHGHWIRKYDTLSQNYNSAENWYYMCSECGGADTNRAKRCSSCGALMDESRDGNSHNGKDDSHE